MAENEEEKVKKTKSLRGRVYEDDWKHLLAAWLVLTILPFILYKLSFSTSGSNDFFAFLGAVIGPLMGGLVMDLISPQFPFIISIFVELSLIPLYLAAVYLLLPHMEESYDKNKKLQTKIIQKE